MYLVNPMLEQIQEEIQARTIKHVFSDYSVFSYMQSFSWIPDAASARYHDLLFKSDYGTRIISPLVNNLLSGSRGPLSESQVEVLAMVIKQRYTAKWERLWVVIQDDNPLHTVNITQAQTGTSNSTKVNDYTDTTTHNISETHTGTDSTQYGKRSSDSGTDSTTYGKVETLDLGAKNTRTYSGGYSDETTGTDTGHVTRSGGQKEAESGTTGEQATHTGTNTTKVEHKGTIADNATSTGTDSVFGFNSVSAVPSASTIASDGNTRTMDNTDTSTETPALNDNTTTTHGKVITTTFDSLKDETSATNTSTMSRTYKDHSIADAKSGADKTSQSGTDKFEHGKVTSLSGTDTKTLNLADAKTGTIALAKTGTGSESKEQSDSLNKSGYDFRRTVDKIELIDKLFNDPAYLDFYNVVYADIASLLTISAFV